MSDGKDERDAPKARSSLERRRRIGMIVMAVGSAAILLVFLVLGALAHEGASLRDIETGKRASATLPAPLHSTAPGLARRRPLGHRALRSPSARNSS